MMKTIKSQIRRCIECLKHKHVMVKEHPTIALAIHRLMERIGIDLAFYQKQTKVIMVFLLSQNIFQNIHSQFQ